MAKIGYDDTPFLPGGKWRVHDDKRPQPKVVTPGKNAGDPPSDAIVLFDGSSLKGWLASEGEAKWKVENGYMEVVPGTGSIHTSEEFGDCQLHVEFCSPSVVKGESQGRGNSGIFLMGKYEVQVLDCYENPTYADGTTGAIYGQYPPLVNACRAPGEWSVYDILFKAPKFHGPMLVEKGCLTVLLNGVVLHHCAELMGFTTHRELPPQDSHGEKGPLELQDHGDLVRFRNIWVRPLKAYDSE